MGFNFSNIIKFLDLYGDYYQLRFADQAKFKTVFGGTFSTVTIIFLILCFLYFGDDFFKRKQPKISIEEGLFETNEIPDLNGTEYPVKPIVIQMTRTFSNLSKLKLILSYNNTFINKYLEECNAEYLDEYFPEKNFTKYTNQFSFYCLNLNDYILTAAGSIAITNVECSKIDSTSLADMLSRNITCNTNVTNAFTGIVTLYTKQIGFKPDLENPFKNKTLTYNFNFLNTYVNYVYMYWNIQYLSDNIGWLIDSIEDSADLAPQPEIIQLTPIDGKKIPGFAIRIFINEKFKKYNRTYQKIQDVLAAFGGFSQLVLFGINFIVSFIRVYFIDMYIIDQKFDEAQPLNESNSHGTKIIKFNNNNVNNNSSVQVLQPNNDSTNLQNLEISKTIFIKPKFTFLTYVKAAVLNSCECREKEGNSVISKLRRKLKVIDNYQDFTFVLKKLNELDVFKKLILSEEQLLCFDFLEKPYVYGEEERIAKHFPNLFKKVDRNKKAVIDYFINLRRSNSMTTVDENLLNLLSQDLKKAIDNN
jgi:hypothetical protein